MTVLVRMLTTAVLVLTMMLPYLAAADDEAVPSEKEVMQSEGAPPLMPHSMPRLDKNGQLTCLSCHEEGKNGAPLTPHAERKMCTQCHVQGEVKKPVKKAKTKK